MGNGTSSSQTAQLKLVFLLKLKLLPTIILCVFAGHSTIFKGTQCSVLILCMGWVGCDSGVHINLESIIILGIKHYRDYTVLCALLCMTLCMYYVNKYRNNYGISNPLPCSILFTPPLPSNPIYHYLSQKEFYLPCSFDFLLNAYFYNSVMVCGMTEHVQFLYEIFYQIE